MDVGETRASLYMLENEFSADTDCLASCVSMLRGLPRYLPSGSVHAVNFSHVSAARATSSFLFATGIPIQPERREEGD